VLWLCAEGEAGKTQGFSIVDVQAVTFNWLLENMPPEYGKSNLQDLFNITPAQAALQPDVVQKSL
jgi:hypothetical protein